MLRVPTFEKFGQPARGGHSLEKENCNAYRKSDRGQSGFREGKSIP